MSAAADFEWMEQAVCGQTDPELWFPDKGNRGRASIRAKELCASCPVQPQCVEHGAGMGEMTSHQHGIWAGYAARDPKPAAGGAP